MIFNDFLVRYVWDAVCWRGRVELCIGNIQSTSKYRVSARIDDKVGPINEEEIPGSGNGLLYKPYIAEDCW